jgi:hypothetical protein
VPFTPVKGTFQLVDKARVDRPIGFARTASGAFQFRFDGIDALELHVPGNTEAERGQPKLLAGPWV